MNEDYESLKEELYDLRDLYFADLKVMHLMIQKLHWRLAKLDGVEYDEAFSLEGENND